MSRLQELRRYLWRAAPVSVRRAAKACYAAIPTPWLMGRGFRANLRFLAESQWWPRERLMRLQESKLRALVAHCYEHVPYYRRVFEARGLRPEDIQSLDDLQKIPLLTKDEVRRCAHELRADNFARWRPTPARSGGTTGSVLHFYIGQAAWDIEWATHWRFFSWAGYRFGDRCVALRGVPRQQATSLWYFDPRTKQLAFNGNNLSPAVLAAIAEELARYRPRTILGYPSVLDIVARYLRAAGKHDIRPHGIITSSETLYPATRALLEEEFRCPVFDWYGLGEHVAFAAQCEHGRYHMGCEYTIMELLNAEGEPVSQGGGEIVGTCLDNYAMPFLRYHTEDRAVAGEASCPCGRQLPTLRAVEGRKGDVVRTPEGRLVSPSILYQCFLDLETVHGVQIVQEAADRISIFLVPGPGYQGRDGERAARLVAEEVGPGMRVSVREVAALTPTEHGKHQLVVSRVGPPLAEAVLQ